MKVNKVVSVYEDMKQGYNTPLDRRVWTNLWRPYPSPTAAVRSGAIARQLSGELGVMDYALAGTKLYMLAWHIYAPDVLEVEYGKSCPPCPFCKSALRVTPNCWSPRGPRRIVGLDKCDFLLSYQYSCVKCPGNIF